MSAAQLPTAVHVVGPSQTVTDYTVESWVVNAAGDAQEDRIYDAAGAHAEDVIYEKRMTKVSAVLLALTGKTFATTFPEGEMCAATGSPVLTAYYVDKCTVTATKGVLRAEIEMTKLSL